MSNFSKSQKTERLASVVAIFVAILLTLAPYYGMVMLGLTVLPVSLTPVGLVFLGVTLIVYGVNVIVYYAGKKKYENFKAQDQLDALLKNKEITRKDPIAARNKIVRSSALYLVYAIVCLILPIVTLCLLSATNEESPLGMILGVLVTLAALFLYFAFFTGVFKRVFTPVDKDEEVSCEKLTKYLEELAKEEGIQKKIKAEIIGGSNIGVSEEKNLLFFHVGLVALLSLTDGELKAVMFHELAHYKHKDTEYSRIKGGILSALNNFFLPYEFLTGMLMPFAGKIAFENEMTEYLSTLYFENKADDDVLKKNVSYDFACANVKLHALDHACSLENGALDKELFGDLGFSKEYVEKLLAADHAYVNKNKDFFEGIAKTYLEERFTTHPNIRERCEKFGVDKVEITLSENDKFMDDVLAFLAPLEKDRTGEDGQKRAKEFFKDYEKYEALLARYENGEELSLSEKNDLMDGAMNRGNYEAVKKTAREILSVDPEQDRARALLGTALLFVDLNEEGIPYLEQTLADPRSSFTSMAMNVLGDYYVSTGNVEGRDKIRSIQIGVADNAAALEKVMDLNFDDKLVPYKEQEVIDKLTSIVEGVEAIKRVIVGTKGGGDVRCHHVLVLIDPLKAEREGMEEKIYEAGHEIWKYLDVLDDQFNLLMLGNAAIPAGHPFMVCTVYKRNAK